jgi:hypothetical protein
MDLRRVARGAPNSLRGPHATIRGARTRRSLRLINAASLWNGVLATAHVSCTGEGLEMRICLNKLAASIFAATVMMAPAAVAAKRTDCRMGPDIFVRRVIPATPGYAATIEWTARKWIDFGPGEVRVSRNATFSIKSDGRWNVRAQYNNTKRHGRLNIDSAMDFVYTTRHPDPIPPVALGSIPRLRHGAQDSRTLGGTLVPYQRNFQVLATSNELVPRWCVTIEAVN